MRIENSFLSFSTGMSLSFSAISSSTFGVFGSDFMIRSDKRQKSYQNRCLGWVVLVPIWFIFIAYKRPNAKGEKYNKFSAMNFIEMLSRYKCR